MFFRLAESALQEAPFFTSFCLEIPWAEEFFINKNILERGEQGEDDLSMRGWDWERILSGALHCIFCSDNQMTWGVRVFSF